MDELFQNVRESCTPQVWSKGVELARQDAVTGEAGDGGLLSLRVKARDKAVSPVVQLAVEDGDWSCSCGGVDDPCAHVAAAVIALKRARESGKELPRSKAAGGKLVYRLTRAGGNLQFERVVVDEAKETVLEVALTALAAGRVAGPPLTATEGDLEIELALGSDRRGALPATVWPRLLQILARGGLTVTLDGAAAVIDPAPVGLLVTIKDDGPGVRLSARTDPDIKEAFANGVALCPTGLRAVQAPRLGPAVQEVVRQGRFYARQELGELVSVVIPALRDQVRLEISATQLPRLGHARPRLELTLSPEGTRLAVDAQIVYGDPVVARIKDGRLVSVGAAVPRRDPDAELRLKDELSRSCNMELGRPLMLEAAEAVRLVQRLGRSAVDVRGAGLAAFTLHGDLAPEVVLGSESLDLSFAAGGKRASGEAVLEAWERGDPMVALDGGGYAPLPSGWLARHGAKVLDLLASRDDQGKLGKAARLPLVALAEELGQPPPAALASLRRALADFQALPPALLPPDFNATLRSYQKQGVDWLAFLQSHELGALLADDMGLGKTLQAIAVLRGKSLVVAPTSVVFNWRAELARFRPGVKVCLYHGPARRLDPAADVVLTTYALLRLDADALAGQTWDVVVLDEAQALKNPDSQVARAARRIDARFRLALSGTPVENRLDDLWSVMTILSPGLLGDRAHFQERYARPVLAGDPERIQALRARLKPFVMRRLKREVAPELPPRTEVVLHVELTPDERERYDVVRAAARKDVLAMLGAGGNVMEALEALLRLRQACCHPALLPGGEARAEAPSAKLTLLVETLTEAVAEGHKALVFSQWTSFLDLIGPALAGAGIPCLRLDGSTTDREGVVKAFGAADGPPVLIMSLKAGGVGLNLTAADHVILADPWWNPAAEDQAADRAHRIGQDRPVLVQRLVALDTVEEKILALQQKKRAVADAAMGTGGAAASGLTRDDLLALLA